MKYLSSLLLLIFSVSLFAQGKVFVANIDSEIDLGLAPYVKRVITEAEEADADAVIFKINTFGGRVDAATQIKDAILDSKILTIAFIDKRAISAGALISLSCQKIAMAPGASIGATTVVDQAGKKQAEKYQSFMRSEMRSTAEKNNRPTDIAEGMVDERVVVEGLVDSTKLITLTTDEAIKYGVADTSLSSIDEVLNWIGSENADIVTVKQNAAEKIIQFLNHPFVTSILLMIIFVGLFTEIKTPGWGLPGTAAIVALIVFFGSGYILDIVSSMDIIIFILGIALLLLEIFVIPGFGIAGVLGILMMISGIFLGLVGDFPIIDYDLLETAVFQLTFSLLGSIVIIYFLLKILPKTKMFNKLILHRNIEEKSGYTAKKEVFVLIGKAGVAITDLRPSGAVKIDGKRIDAVTHGDYIEKGAHVTVVEEEGSKVLVEKIN
ncbi:MAG: nodulation protein NfeD [Chlorobi bacterium]|nr:nodulation protein NfeD [Chlorobiota bacterium]